MKILYHHRTLAKDGMNVHIQEMVAALKRRNHEVMVVGPEGDPGQQSMRATVSGSATNAIRSFLPAPVAELGELAYSEAAYRKLKAAYVAFQPDILYERYNLFLLAGLRLSRKHGLPMLLEVNAPLARERSTHGNLSWRRLAQRLEAKVWCGANVVLPVTQVLAEHVTAAGVAEDRIHVVPNGVDLRRFSPEVDNEEIRGELHLTNRVVLGFTGFLRPWHGIDRIIDVIADHGTTCNLHFLIVGDGPARTDLETKADKLGVTDRVQFVGAVDREDIPRYVAAFDIALQPSAVAYASPLKLVEYMAMGKAIIAPDQPNIRELIEDKENGLLVGEGDMAALAGSVVLMAKNPDLRSRLGREAARNVRLRGLTWDANAKRIEEMAAQMSGTPKNPTSLAEPSSS